MMYDDNQKKINGQDDILDQIIDSAEMTKGQAAEMDDTMKYQDDLIYNLDKKTNANIGHLEKTNSKLDDVLAKQSNCCLYITIFLELVVMILLIVM